MTHSEKAQALFTQGYNCAQSVFLAFEDVTGISRDTGARLSSSFGGGMGRMREVCGALTGAFMVLGLVYGYSSPLAKEEKADHYRRIQEFAGQFRESCGSILCRELLDHPDTAPIPQERNAAYYASRPCEGIVGRSAALLDQYLLNHPVK